RSTLFPYTTLFRSGRRDDLRSDRGPAGGSGVRRLLPPGPPRSATGPDGRTALRIESMERNADRSVSAPDDLFRQAASAARRLQVSRNVTAGSTWFAVRRFASGRLASHTRA